MQKWRPKVSDGGPSFSQDDGSSFREEGGVSGLNPWANRGGSTIADVSEDQMQPHGANSAAAVDHERAELSPRELDALRLVVQGLANKQIAAQMAISESAVKNTLQQLFAKTEVRPRSQLVRVALERYRDLL